MYDKTTPATIAGAGTLPFTGLDLMTIFYVSLALLLLAVALRLIIARRKSKA